MENTNTETANIKDIVKEKYGQAALRAGSGGSSCCGAAPASGNACDPITSNLYDATEMEQVPEKAMQASLGCGNPTALAKLSPGRRCWTSAREAELTFCFRHGGSDRPARLTAWI